MRYRNFVIEILLADEGYVAQVRKAADKAGPTGASNIEITSTIKELTAHKTPKAAVKRAKQIINALRKGKKPSRISERTWDDF